MLDPAKFALFVSISWVLIIAPGPDMLYVITRGMAHGRKAGVVSAIGVVCGILIHTMAASFGITLVFQTSVFAFVVVKYLGAIYLIYIGVKAWLDKSTLHLQESTSTSIYWALFWQGMLSNILNPKIAVFFLAFLPQFVVQESSQMALQMTILGLTFALLGLCFLVWVGYFAGSVGTWVKNQPRYTKSLRWLTGSVLVSLGVWLAFLNE